MTRDFSDCDICAVSDHGSDEVPASWGKVGPGGQAGPEGGSAEQPRHVYEISHCPFPVQIQISVQIASWKIDFQIHQSSLSDLTADPHCHFCLPETQNLIPCLSHHLPSPLPSQKSSWIGVLQCRESSSLVCLSKSVLILR